MLNDLADERLLTRRSRVGGIGHGFRTRVRWLVALQCVRDGLCQTVRELARLATDYSTPAFCIASNVTRVSSLIWGSNAWDGGETARPDQMTWPLAESSSVVLAERPC